MSLSPQQRLLATSADPAAPLPAEAVASRESLESLLGLAERHGVRPIVIRKLRSAPPSEIVREALDAARTRSTFAAGQSMLLRHHAATILGRLGAGGVNCRIVKGPIFADRLYPQAADRPFTDIDILLSPDGIDAANALMEKLGFGLPAGLEASAELMEYKWHLATNNSILVELHTDLVHLPGMRRRLSMDFERLARIDDGEADSPAAMLSVAVVHAAGGHKFHRLQLLVDVLQAVRALRSAEDEERAIKAARDAGAALEFATVLDVTARVFGEARAARLADRIARSLSVRISQALVSPRVVLDAGMDDGWRSRLRRDAFRWVQRMQGEARGNSE